MSDIQFGKDAQDKEVDRLEDLFWEANRDTLDKPKFHKVVADQEPPKNTEGHWRMVSVRRAELADYGLEPPDDKPRYSIWKRGDRDFWQFDGPPPRMDYSKCGTGENREKTRNVDNAVYFNHLPGGYREFPNKRAAAAWLSQNMPGVEFKD